jgi:hypothetical protein
MPRPTPILIAALALLAALQARCALAGFIRVDVSTLTGEETLLAFADSRANRDFAQPSTSAGPLTPHDNRPSIQTIERIAQDSGACGSQASSPSSGSGSNSAAVASAISQVPQPPLVGRLPTEMGPSFSEPPPWRPLRPPRADAGLRG